jgi:hypothetical protein
MHFGKNCGKARLEMSKNHRRAKAVVQPPPVEHQESLTDYPWDDEDSFYKVDEAANGNFTYDNNNSGAPNNQAGIYSKSTNTAALRYGIHFTTKQYHETMLLKILSDANTSHYLYKEVMEWGRAAKHANYDFNPNCSSRNAQVKYLMNWLQYQNSCPQQIPTTLLGPVKQVMQTTCFNFSNQLYLLVSD